jgi:hypothetical protein
MRNATLCDIFADRIRQGRAHRTAAGYIFSVA